MSIVTEINAKKESYADEDAWQVIAEATKVYVASGKNIIEFNPATADKDKMLKKITGRTGNLRAPTLKLGDRFYVGYNIDMYEKLG